MSSSQQAAPEYFAISQESSVTEYLTAASGRVVTLEAKKAASGRDVTLEAAFDDTQLWEKKEAFFLSSKSKTEYAPVEQLPDDRRIGLRSPAMDGLWTESDDLGDGLIYIQKASDTNPEEGTYGTVVLRQKRPEGSDPKDTSRWKMERRVTPGTNTEYFTISQQESSGTKYLTAASGRVVTTLEAKKAKKNEKAAFDATQLWEKKEAFFLRPKSNTKDALVELLPYTTIELRETPPAMDGLWTSTKCYPNNTKCDPKDNELIYIQKASDPEHVLDNGPASVELEKKRKAGSSPKDTSRWKMERRVTPEHAGTGASAVPIPPTVNICANVHTENPGSADRVLPKKTAHKANAPANSIGSNRASRHGRGKKT